MVAGASIGGRTVAQPVPRVSMMAFSTARMADSLDCVTKGRYRRGVRKSSTRDGPDRQAGDALMVTRSYKFRLGGPQPPPPGAMRLNGERAASRESPYDG